MNRRELIKRVVGAGAVAAAAPVAAASNVVPGATFHGIGLPSTGAIAAAAKASEKVTAQREHAQHYFDLADKWSSRIQQLNTRMHRVWSRGYDRWAEEDLLGGFDLYYGRPQIFRRCPRCQDYDFYENVNYIEAIDTTLCNDCVGTLGKFIDYYRGLVKTMNACRDKGRAILGTPPDSDEVSLTYVSRGPGGTSGGPY